MSELDALRRRQEELRRVLEQAPTDPTVDPVQLRESVVSLFRQIERLAAEVAELRESVRPLVHRYRELFPGLAAAAPKTPPVAPVRAEHLDASTYLERAWSSIAAGRYDEALRESERAAALAPADSQGRILRGWALMRLDRLAEARSTLEAVLAEEPTAPLARASLGYVALRERSFSEALDHLSRAARADGDRKAALYANLYLGMLYTAREMYREGRSFLERALELGPHLVEAYWEMGRSYYREGQFSLALDAWRKGAEVNRFSPWADRCRQAVERAGSGVAVSLD